MSVDFPYIPAILDKFKKSKISMWPVRSNWASQMGDPCLRKLVYFRTSWEKRTPHDVDLQYIFDEGHDQEANLTIELQKSLRAEDIQFMEQQKRIEIEGTDISGKIDGTLVYNGQYFPVDLKSCDPNVWSSLREEHPEDFDKYNWTKKYPAQLLLYMYAENAEGGMFFLKNKSSGKVKQFSLRLHDYLDYIESLLKKDADIKNHMTNKTLPKKLNNPDVCKGCPFEHICGPDLEFNGIDFEHNPELENRLNRITELKPFVSEYNKIDGQIKPMIKGKSFNCGNFLVEGKWVTKRLPATEARETTYWQKTITQISN